MRLKRKLKSNFWQIFKFLEHVANISCRNRKIRRGVLAKRAFKKVKKMKEEAINSQKSTTVVTSPPQIQDRESRVGDSRDNYLPSIP